VVLFILGTIGVAFLGLPRVASFSLSVAAPQRHSASHKGTPPSIDHRQSWFLKATRADADVAAAATETRSLMEAQAGGNNRRRRKQRIRNSSDAKGKTKGVTTKSLMEATQDEELPDPLVSFESVESVRLLDSESSSGVRVELMIRSDGESKTGERVVLDPRKLHQTSDFDLWMALRKHVVDVSASQLSVVLGTNYFTSREKLLQDKIEARTSSGGGSEDPEENVVFLGSDDEDAKHPVQSNSKACAWGIKMEPLAFAQYSDLVEATNLRDDNDVDDEEGKDSRNKVEETGMHLLKHVDPKTQKTYVFGASPDGMVTEHVSETESTPRASVGLLEIKSLWGRRHKNSLPEFDRCPSRFYDQIQGQLAICNREWCDLMLFIPPGDATKGSANKKKRKGKSAKKQKKQASAAAAKGNRKAKGRNYSIVRVKRNEAYWTETVLPALIEFCDEVEAGIADTKAEESKDEGGGE
jgi:hypothetical protein